MAGALGSATCSGNEAFWVQPQEECPACWSSVNAHCVPTAAGNLVSLLRAATGHPAYNYNDGLDTAVAAAYTYTDKGDQFFHGAQHQAALYLGGAQHPDPTKSMAALMNTDYSAGTAVGDARVGLTAFLQATDALPGHIVTWSDRPPGVSDMEFLVGVRTPYLLHISADCIRSGMWASANGEAPSEIVKALPTADRSALSESSLGHTIAVYSAAPPQASSLTVGGASGLGASRSASNARGCDKAYAVVLNTEQCVVGITRVEAASGSSGLPAWAIAAIVVGAVAVAAGGVVAWRWRAAGATGLMTDYF